MATRLHCHLRTYLRTHVRTPLQNDTYRCGRPQAQKHVILTCGQARNQRWDTCSSTEVGAPASRFVPQHQEVPHHRANVGSVTMLVSSQVQLVLAIS